MSIYLFIYYSGQSLEHCFGWIDALERSETLRTRLLGLRQRIERITGYDPMFRRRAKSTSAVMPVTLSNPADAVALRDAVPPAVDVP